MSAKTGAPQVAREGQILLVDSGSYSDYQVEGIFRVLRDFDPLAEWESFRLMRMGKDAVGNDGFLAHLATSGLIEDAEHSRLYLGGVCDPAPSFQP